MMMRANCFVSSSRVAPTVNWRRAGRASACWFVSTSQRLAGDLHVHEMFAHFLNEIARAARLCPINKEPVDIKQNNSVKCKTWQRRRLTDWNEAADPCGGESEWTKRKRRELAEASVPVAAGRCWCRRRISGAAGDKPRQFWPWRLFCGRRRWAKSGSGPAASTRSARRNGGLRRRHSRRRPSTILPSTRPTSAHTIPAAGSLLTLRASGCQSARATRLNCLPFSPFLHSKMNKILLVLFASRCAGRTGRRSGGRFAAAAAGSRLMSAVAAIGPSAPEFDCTATFERR